MDRSQEDEIDFLNELFDDDVTEEQWVEKAEESDNQIDHLTKETKAQSTDLHDVVVEEAVHPQEQCVEKTEESLQSCEQDQSKNVAAESAEQEEQQTEVNQKEIESADVQQEPFVEQKNESCDSSEENNNPVRKEENTTSSGSTSEGSRRRTLRQGLRSSSKKEDAAPKFGSKKQPELVTPVRRSLRSNKTISEAAVVTEVADHSVTHLG
ncbi:hypothetical protein Hdeb2414_s0005g00163151 [Helianthus debilis subsp. tardiflorus]